MGSSHYIGKFDLIKGYRQVPLTSFNTLGRTCKCLALLFGLKNAPAWFQRMMHSLMANIPGCITCIDDVIIYSDTWQDHLSRVEALLRVLEKANLVLNVIWCELRFST